MVLDGHSESFDIAELAQSLPGRVYAASSSCLGEGRDETDPREGPSLLGLGGERRGEEATGERADEGSPVDHSIT